MAPNGMLENSGPEEGSHLLRAIFSAVINGNADPKSLSPIDLGLLELLQSESFARTLLGVVPDSLTADNWANETRNRTGKHTLSLCQPVLPPPVLPGSLIEPGFDPAFVGSLVMPVLVEVSVGDLDAEVRHPLPENKSAKFQIISSNIYVPVQWRKRRDAEGKESMVDMVH